MAYVVTAKILVDSLDDVDADKKIHKILEQLVDGDIIDFSTERVAVLNTVIDDMIVNGTYAPGQFSQDWIIFSNQKNNNDGKGYWSNEFGWEDKDLATIYDSEMVKMPEGVDDAVLIMRSAIR